MGFIAGIVDFENKDKQGDAAQRMAEALRHRGGSLCTALTDCAALAHGSHTEAQSIELEQDGRRYIVCFDAELYNRAELEQGLGGAPSLARLLLCAYLKWGFGFARRLLGPFAISIWDESEQRLLLARDRVGLKPLFYHDQGSKLVFGSQLSALLAAGVPPVIGRSGIMEIFALFPARTPGCGVFKDVNELPPGHTLVFEQSGASISAYYRLAYAEHTDNLETTAETVRGLLADSVARQSSGAAAMLSGGLDSSIIAAMMSKGACTYSVDYAQNEQYFKSSLFQPDPDAQYVDKMASHIGSRHRKVVLKPQELATALRESMRMRDLPGMADIDASLLLFCREIKKDFDAVLSGEGSDELFGGYPWFYRSELAAADGFPWSGDVAYRQSFLSGELAGCLDLLAYSRERMRESMLGAPEYGGNDAREARMRNLFYLNMQWFMANLIERSDRMSMANGLSLRMPFADHRLLEYVFNIPWGMKFLDGREKGLLRKAATGLLPDEVLWRKKSPYPKTYHPDFTAAVKALLRDEMYPSSVLLELVDARALDELLCGGAIGKPWFGQLMSGPQLIGFMAQLGMWLREYKVRIEL